METNDPSDADDEPVGHGLFVEGKPMPTAVQFGHMRRLRKALLSAEADRVGLGELERLSKAATPGLCTIWQNTPLMLRDDTSNAWALTGTYTREPAQAKANAEFLKALWNAYRAGYLVSAPHPQGPNTLSEVEEARALLEKEKRAYKGNPSEIVKYLRWRADLVGDEPETRLDLLSRADAINRAIFTLRASQEQDSEVRDA